MESLQDLVFNLDCHDVVRSNRFVRTSKPKKQSPTAWGRVEAMVKVPFSSGGCSAQLARSDKATFVRVGRPTGVEPAARACLGPAFGHSASRRLSRLKGFLHEVDSLH